MGTAQSFDSKDLRNVVLLGPSSVGKTTLSEAILHRCQAITRMGRVADENTVGDYDAEARAHHHSTTAAVLFGSFEGKEINLIDTPGHPELVGQALAAVPAADTALLVIDAGQGLEWGARRLFHRAGEAGLARMIVVNKIDQHLAVLPRLVESLRESLGSHVHCINLPTPDGKDVVDCFDQESGETAFLRVSDVHQEILESAIEIDDEKLERYLEGQTIDLPELRACFVKSMVQGHVVPVLFTAAEGEVGVDDLLHILAQEAPSPCEGRTRRLIRQDAEAMTEAQVEVQCTDDAPLLARVFKLEQDAHSGTVAFLRILQGTMSANTSFCVAQEKKPRRAGHVLKVEGREHNRLEGTAHAGDIVAMAKMEGLSIGQVIRDTSLEGEYRVTDMRYPNPMYSLAITPTKRNDEAKLAAGLSKLSEEDPTFRVTHNAETHEQLMSGLGELHLRIMLERLEHRTKVQVTTQPPRVAYRETIRNEAEGHYRHKKQSGGAGQFAEVFLRVQPLARGEGFQFANETFGGSIPHQFISSVEKGARDALERGVLAGFAVEDVRVVVYDGKSHPVDSKDIAFRTAAKHAVREALSRAQPVLLEPLVDLHIRVPERYLGEVTGDLHNRRARILGVSSPGEGISLVQAQTPLAELANYPGELRGLTGGQGTFVFEDGQYDLVPAHLQQRIVEENSDG